MKSITLGGEPAFDTANAATYLGLVAASTLVKWRCIGYPDIPHYKVGRQVLYKQSDLDAFIARRRKGGDGEDLPADNPPQPAAATAPPKPRAKKPERAVKPEPERAVTPAASRKASRPQKTAQHPAKPGTKARATSTPRKPRR